MSPMEDINIPQAEGAETFRSRPLISKYITSTRNTARRIAPNSGGGPIASGGVSERLCCKSDEGVLVVWESSGSSYDSAPARRSRTNAHSHAQRARSHAEGALDEPGLADDTVLEREQPSLALAQIRVVCGRGRNPTLSVFASNVDDRYPATGILRSG